MTRTVATRRDTSSGSVVVEQVDFGAAIVAELVANATGLVAVQSMACDQHVQITFTGYSIPITDTGGANGGQGNLLLMTLPAAMNQVFPTIVNLTTVARVGTALAAGAALVGSVGTTAAATANATLTGTEADFVASVACTLTAGSGAFAGTGVTAFAQDGRTTAKAVYLNFAVPDADISATDAILVTGTIDISWKQLAT